MAASSPVSALKYQSAEDCPNRRRHTKCPEGYLSWHAWAERKLRTHYQIRCMTCGYFSIWLKRNKPLSGDEVEALLSGSANGRL